MRLVEELKRRNVFRVGAAYLLLGWLTLQVTDTVAPALNLPDWTLSFVTWIGVIGFPFALFFAWAFELTPDGIKREEDVDRSDSITQHTSRKLDVALIVLMITVIGFIAWHSFSPAGKDPAPTGDDAVAATASTAPRADDSIAVLPLINMSEVSENAFFAGWNPGHPKIAIALESRTPKDRHSLESRTPKDRQACGIPGIPDTPSIAKRAEHVSLPHAACGGTGP